MSRPIPPTLITDAPLRCLEFNEQWSEYILEALQKLNYQSSWEGDESERYTAQQQIEILMNQLNKPCGGKMLFSIVNYVSNVNSSQGYQHINDSNIAGFRTMPANFDYQLGDVFKSEYFFAAVNADISNRTIFITLGFGGNFPTYGLAVTAGDSANVHIEATMTVDNIRTEAGTGRPIIDIFFQGKLTAYRSNVDVQRHAWNIQDTFRYADTALSFSLASQWNGGGTNVQLLSYGGNAELKRI